MASNLVYCVIKHILLLLTLFNWRPAMLSSPVFSWSGTEGTGLAGLSVSRGFGDIEYKTGANATTYVIAEIWSGEKYQEIPSAHFVEEWGRECCVGFSDKVKRDQSLRHFDKVCWKWLMTKWGRTFSFPLWISERTHFVLFCAGGAVTSFQSGES